MKNANAFLPRLVLTLALAAAAVAWIPQEKSKRKMRMADAASELGLAATAPMG